MSLNYINGCAPPGRVIHVISRVIKQGRILAHTEAEFVGADGTPLIRSSHVKYIVPPSRLWNMLLAMRTSGTDHDFGQKDSAPLSIPRTEIEDDESVGVFSPFFDATHVERLKLVKRGEATGDSESTETYATFALVGGGTGDKSLEGVLQGCSAMSPLGDVSAASATEWTSAYSGTLDVDGGLRMGNGCDEQDTPQYVLVCGISLSLDDDTSVLAFTSAMAAARSGSSTSTGPSSLRKTNTMRSTASPVAASTAAA